MATVPVVLAGAMTVTMNLAGPLESAAAATKQRPAKAKSELGKSLGEIVTAALRSARVTTTAAATPGSYTVVAGDSVSSIAARYRLSTASLLALNGLSWKSLIFPGQVLKLAGATAGAAPTTPTAVVAVTSPTRYTIQRGDTISRIAARFGVSTQAVLSANGLGWSSIIYGGQTIVIPSGGSAPLAIQTVAAITPMSPSAGAPAVVPPSGSTRYTIRTGDTISSIARGAGLSISALLAANGLTASSMIYAGRTLIIPAGAPSSSAPASAVSASTTLVSPPVTGPLNAEMAGNARVIIQVGQRLGVPDRGIIVALAAAAQESGLRNLSFGDRDSVGIFQQRPSMGWGSTAQLLTVDYAARLFYGGPSNPNKGKTRGLLDIAGWQNMTVAQAAQAVQISAYPDAYGAWQSSATSWLAHYR